MFGMLKGYKPAGPSKPSDPSQPPSEQASWKATPQPTAPSPLPPTPTDSFHHSPLPQYPPNSRHYASTPAPSAWRAAPALPSTSPQSHPYSRGGSIHLPSPVMSQGRGHGREFLLSDLAEIAIQHGQRTEREGRERSTATLPTFRSLPSPVKNSWRRSDEAASRSASSSGIIAGTAMSSRTASAESRHASHSRSASATRPGPYSRPSSHSVGNSRRSSPSAPSDHPLSGLTLDKTYAPYVPGQFEQEVRKVLNTPTLPERPNPLATASRSVSQGAGFSALDPIAPPPYHPPPQWPYDQATVHGFANPGLGHGWIHALDPVAHARLEARHLETEQLESRRRGTPESFGSNSLSSSPKRPLPSLRSWPPHHSTGRQATSAGRQRVDDVEEDVRPIRTARSLRSRITAQEWRPLPTPLTAQSHFDTSSKPSLLRQPPQPYPQPQSQSQSSSQLTFSQRSYASASSQNPTPTEVGNSQSLSQLNLAPTPTSAFPAYSSIDRVSGALRRPFSDEGDATMISPSASPRHSPKLRLEDGYYMPVIPETQALTALDPDIDRARGQTVQTRSHSSSLSSSMSMHSTKSVPPMGIDKVNLPSPAQSLPSHLSPSILRVTYETGGPHKRAKDDLAIDCDPHLRPSGVVLDRDDVTRDEDGHAMKKRRSAMNLDCDTFPAQKQHLSRTKRTRKKQIELNLQESERRLVNTQFKLEKLQRELDELKSLKEVNAELQRRLAVLEAR